MSSWDFGTFEIRLVELDELTIPDTVPKGTRFQVAGRARIVSSRSTRTTHASATIILEWSADGRVWSGRTESKTDADGRFSFAARASGERWWRLKLPEQSGKTFCVPPYMLPFQIDTRAKSRISVDAGTAPIRRGRRLTVLGGVQYLDGDRWLGVAHAEVTVYFKARGGKDWSVVARARTDRQGRYEAAFRVLREGSWQVRFAGDDDRYQAATESNPLIVR
jgi:hypothetical protein